MPQMQRNLPHIMAMAFNEPLLLEPAYGRVFFCALSSQLGIAHLNDTYAGDGLSAAQMNAVLAMPGFAERDSPPRTYQVNNGIAILPVSGTLVTKTSALQSYSGMTGYNGIVNRLQQAMSDPDVDGILMDFDTPGGLASGAFDCADMIYRLRDVKPVWALTNDMSCSAGQMLASACSHRLVTQTSRVGSIGVMMAHNNYAGALEQNGVEVTLLFSGKHKVEGNPYEKLPADVRERLQERMDLMRQKFAEKMATYTKLTVQDVLDTEAQVYEGSEALDIGLADELVMNTDAIGIMREAINSKKTTTVIGVNMSVDQDLSQLSDASAGTASPDAQLSAQISAAVTAENARIMGILGCDESKGREALAHALASTPGMTIENAKRYLAASPLSAQARTDTALDALMSGSPAALQAGMQSGNESADAFNDIPEV